MKRFLCLLPLLLLASCSAAILKKPQLCFTYDDFGPEAVVASWLGPRDAVRPVIVYHGASYEREEAHYLNVGEAMRRMRASARRLSKDDPARMRMSRTYSRLYDFYRTRRDALMAAPFASFARGGMNRAMMMPPMPLTL